MTANDKINYKVIRKMEFETANKSCHKEDILHAAIIEFGKAGYKAASTNEIIKNAKVSKGLLFHYFTDKENLYKACYAYVIEKYGKFMTENLKFTSPDLFDRLLQALKVKMEYGCKEPEVLAFINRDWSLVSRPDLEKLAKEKNPETLAQFTASLYEGVDTSKFRKGLDVEKIMDITRLALEASWERFILKYDNDMSVILENIGVYLAEAEEIIDLLKNGAYEK